MIQRISVRWFGLHIFIVCFKKNCLLTFSYLRQCRLFDNRLYTYRLQKKMIILNTPAERDITSAPNNGLSLCRVWVNTISLDSSRWAQRRPRRPGITQRDIYIYALFGRIISWLADAPYIWPHYTCAVSNRFPLDILAKRMIRDTCLADGCVL